MTHLNLDVAKIEEDHKRGTRNFHRDRVGSLLDAYHAAMAENRTMRRQRRRHSNTRAELRKVAGTLSIELEQANERIGQLTDELYPGKPMVATQEDAGVYFAKAIARMGHESTAREVFFSQLLGRLSKGEHEHGDRSFDRSPEELLTELRDQSLDFCGWGFVLWRRIQFSIDNLRRDLFEEADEDSEALKVSRAFMSRSEHLKKGRVTPNSVGMYRNTVDQLEGLADQLREMLPDDIELPGITAPENRKRMAAYKGPNPGVHPDGQSGYRCKIPEHHDLEPEAGS